MTIAEIDTKTIDAMLRTGNKSAFLDVFKQNVDLEEWYNEIDEHENTSSVGIDVMWFIRSLSHLHIKKSESYARRMFDSIIKRYLSQNIDLVADRYDGL